jgi:sulfur carrier protein
MKVYLNNKEVEISNDTTIEEVLKNMALNKWASVWVNDRQLLEREYPTYNLKENDDIKVIRILAGG